MKIIKRILPSFRLSPLIISVAILVALADVSASVHGQFNNTPQIDRLLNRLETDTARFNKSLDSALDRSRLNNTILEDQVNALVDELEFATDRLQARADDGVVINLDVHDVLRRGKRLDTFMQTHYLSAAAERDWRQVKNDLNRLAQSYGLAWSWVPNRINDSSLNRASTRQVIRRLEQLTDQFRESFDSALDRSKLDGSSYEDFMNNTVAKFEHSMDRLEDQANGSAELNSADVRLALSNAAAIDDFLKRQTVTTRTRRDWARVKANLDDLAFLNRVAWNWSLKPNVSPVANNIPQAQGQRVGLSAIMNPSLSTVAREVRHELLSDLPYYSVFDWIEFEVLPDNTVVLRGEVTTPPDTKSRAAEVVADVDGVRRVVNEIRVLPVSPNDERLRRTLYNEIYGFNSPLFKYGVGSRQAIHIIVDGGHATLKGVVETQADKQIAYARARGVAGLFGVNNELVVNGQSLAR